MADLEKTTTPTKEVPAATSAPTSTEEPISEVAAGDTTLPSGWMYRERKLGSLTIPWYASPKVQLGMVAAVCFLCPGMFNALNGLGGGGKTDATIADNMVSFECFHLF